MTYSEKMPEAEVSLRLAFFLIQKDIAFSDISVAIDGAQVKILDKIHFRIIDFLAQYGWLKGTEKTIWQGKYLNPKWKLCIDIHSHSGQCDVVAKLKSGHMLRVESKKGSLQRTKSSQEYRLLREALGQLLTIESVGDKDILAVAVPSSERFEDLSIRWREAPLIKRSGIQFLNVDRNNNVKGLIFS